MSASFRLPILSHAQLAGVACACMCLHLLEAAGMWRPVFAGKQAWRVS